MSSLRDKAQEAGEALKRVRFPAVEAAFPDLNTSSDNQSVRCPFHDDRAKSAIINVKKGFFHCFTESLNLTILELEERLTSTTSSPTKSSEISSPPTAELSVSAQSPADGVAYTYLAGRGLQESDLKVTVCYDPDAEYVVLLSADGSEQYVARYVGRGDSPRYQNPPGDANLWWASPPPPAASEDTPVWLVEGAFDAMSLVAASRPGTCVASALGSSLSDRQAYSLRNRTVFIVFDLDVAGWQGARHVAEKLELFSAKPIIFELPAGDWNDVSEYHQKNPGKLHSWIEEKTARYSSTDLVYVERLFGGKLPPIRVIPTGLAEMDEVCGGGWLPGLHGVGGMPGEGKSTLAVYFSVAASTLSNCRVLYATYELPKPQVWARHASVFSKHRWSDLEKDPLLLEKSAEASVREISSRVRVVHGATINELHYLSHGFDMVVVDYLQTIPSRPGAQEPRQEIEHNLKSLASLAQKREVPILLITSIPRGAYNNPTSTAMGKETGNLEYQVATMQRLENVALGVEQRVSLGLLPHHAVLRSYVLKNTRGEADMSYYVLVDFQHQRVSSLSSSQVWDLSKIARVPRIPE